ncbi:helix-turn-helix domain-containing protein [Melissococcus sp. OM08-11BH]|nr:helix-turn-helix transcriptional regulator [Melissococcus sp. OM08-11BH]
MNISDKLKNNRKQAGLTQEKIAQNLHVSRQIISNWGNR